jgi:hypothetical protein
MYFAFFPVHFLVVPVRTTTRIIRFINSQIFLVIQLPIAQRRKCHVLWNLEDLVMNYLEARTQNLSRETEKLAKGLECNNLWPFYIFSLRRTEFDSRKLRPCHPVRYWF